MLNFRSDAHIAKRRAEEARLASLNTHLKKQWAGEAQAHWELKTDKLVNKHVVSQRIKTLHQERDRDLAQRRSRLAIQLQQEEEQYQRELIANVETPQQVRNKMAKRLHELKSKREEERIFRVTSMNDKRFKDSTDELRLEDSVNFNHKCRIEQENQMFDKQNRLQKEVMEEELYSLLWKQDMQKKIEREKKEHAEKKEAVENRLKILDWQRDQLKSSQVAERAKIVKEQEMLRNQWKEEEESEKRKQQQTFEVNRARNLEIIKHNELTEQLRKLKEQDERLKDKQMIEGLLLKEREISQAEQDEKMRIRDEAKRMMNFVDNKAERARIEEQELEKAINEEATKQYEKQAKVWKEEADAKATLMKDVYIDRDRAVEQHKILKNEQATQLENEKKGLEGEINRELMKEEEEKLKKQMKMKQYQEDLLRQIEEKDRNKKKEFKEEMYERRAKLIAELDYRRKIDQQKYQAKSELDALRAQRPF